MDLISFVQDLTLKIMMVSWVLFLLTWAIGWALRGSPIPMSRIKRTGQSLIEDAVWAAFWLAMGSSVFSLIYFIVSRLGAPIPPPPLPPNTTTTSTPTPQV